LGKFFMEESLTFKIIFWIEKYDWLKKIVPSSKRKDFLALNFSKIEVIKLTCSVVKMREKKLSNAKFGKNFLPQCVGAFLSIFRGIHEFKWKIWFENFFISSGVFSSALSLSL